MRPWTRWVAHTSIETDGAMRTLAKTLRLPVPEKGVDWLVPRDLKASGHARRNRLAVDVGVCIQWSGVRG